MESNANSIDLSHLAGDSHRSRLAFWLEQSGIGAMSDLFQIGLSLVAMGLYIASTCKYYVNVVMMTCAF